MRAKLAIVLLLIAALFAGTNARAVVRCGEAAEPAMTCPPCADCPNDMACCTSGNQPPAPAQPALPNHRAALELAATPAQIFSFLYVLPPPQHRLLVEDEAGESHTLPPLAATCIWLI